MNLSSSLHIAQTLEKELGIAVEYHGDVLQPFLQIKSEDLHSICTFLNKTPGFYFDFLHCITCVDNGPSAGTLDLIYHLSSLPLEHGIILKMTLPREDSEAPSLTELWKTADWHEREIFDLFGVKFTGHPDLRRILLPADWQGHPLRKDYVEQTHYHGIKVKWE